MKMPWGKIIGARLVQVSNPHTTTLKLLLRNDAEETSTIYVAWGVWSFFKDKECLGDSEAPAFVDFLSVLEGLKVVRLVMINSLPKEGEKWRVRAVIGFEGGYRLVVWPHDEQLRKDIALEHPERGILPDEPSELLQVFMGDVNVFFWSDGLVRPA